MRDHITILAWLLIVFSGIGVVIGLLLLLLLLGIGGLASAGAGLGAVPFLGLFGAVGMFIVGLFAVISLPGLLAGIGILQRAEWGRVLGIIVSVLHLPNFPFGTVIGVYGLVVLFDQQVQGEFRAAG